MKSTISSLINWLRYKLKYGKVQSLTFYIPSPPERKTGYREKQFDKLFFDFINQGFDILHFSTQTNANPEHSGMWIVCVVRAKNAYAENLKLDAFFGDTLSLKTQAEKIDENTSLSFETQKIEIENEKL